jgi:hypothetical protein
MFLVVHRPFLEGIHDRLYSGDGLDSLGIKSVRQKLHIPGLSVRDPEVNGAAVTGNRR